MSYGMGILAILGIYVVILATIMAIGMEVYYHNK